MEDPYFGAIQDQWDNIQMLYKTYEKQRPILLYDIDDQQIQVHRYRTFKKELKPAGRASLSEQYRTARANNQMVVFVRDNKNRKLFSYSIDRESDA